LRPAEKKSNEKAVFFLHIPKCAGTTLTEEIIKKKFKPHQSIIFYEHGTEVLIDRLKGMSRKEQEKIKCIAGHFAFGIHRYYTVGPVTYITLLRDPIERVISHYYFVLRREEHYLHKIVKEKNYTLEEYVENKLTVELNNGQTRILAGIGWGAEFGKCPSTMFEKAKENLETYFTAVGISERFDGFLELLNHKMGWEIPEYQNRNVRQQNSRATEIDNKTLEVIRKYNRFDIELYKYVQSFFSIELDKYLI
jgi:hypothetical protein